MRVFGILSLVLGLYALDLPAQSIDADTLFNSAMYLNSVSEFEASQKNFDQAAEKYWESEDTVQWIRKNLDFGESLVTWGRVEDGLVYFHRVDELDIEQISLVLAGITKNNLGWAYKKREQYRLALEYYKEGIRIADQTDDSLLIGRLHNNVSYVYQVMGKYMDALRSQEKAKKIYEEIGSNTRLSFVLNGIFLTLSDLGLHEKAVPYIRRSLAIREVLKDKTLLDVSYHNMAMSFYNRGIMDSAVIYYNRSLQLSRELQNPYQITETLNNIGLVYSQMGKYEWAVQYFGEALSINRSKKRPDSITLNLINLGNISIRTGDYAVAEEYFNEALEWMESVPSPRRRTDLYFKIANVKLIEKKYQDAREYIDKGMSIAIKVGLKEYEAEGHSLLAKQYEQQGDWIESLREYKRAYEDAARWPSTEYIGRAIRLAKAYRRVDPDSSYIIADEIISQLNSMRNSVSGLSFKTGYFRDYAEFYNEVASWYVKDGKDIPKALYLIESAKARVLMDELAEAEQNIYRMLDDSVVLKKQSLLWELDYTYDKLRMKSSESTKDSLKKRLKDQNFRYQTFLNEIRVQIPEWKEFKYPTPLPSKEIQKFLDRKTGLIEFAFSKGRLIRFCISYNEVQAIVIDSLNGSQAEQELSDWVRKYRKAINEQVSINELKALTEPMLAALMPDIEALHEAEIENIVIVPDGPLSFLPFEALTLKGTEGYLIESFNIKYLPSASIYSFIQSPHRATSFDLLALAGSGFKTDEKGSNYTDLPSLPSTLLEVDSIAVNFKKVTVFKNERVTESKLKSLDLGAYQYIHFATHAVADAGNPSQSGLVLQPKSNMGDAQGEDGYLNRNEISELSLNAELTTLSACNTGLGEVISGEGLLGLQRSFLSAGSSSVIVSLWSVYDRSTAEFMTTFYREMLSEKEKDYGWFTQMLNRAGLHVHPMFDYKTEALRAAKLTMIAHPYYNKPVHWAPFILIGK